MIVGRITSLSDTVRIDYRQEESLRKVLREILDLATLHGSIDSFNIELILEEEGIKL